MMNKTLCVRLNPKEDLKKRIMQICAENKIQAACVLSSVGSLSQLKLRLANASQILEKSEYFEIISLNGTVSVSGIHLHMAVADQNGQVLGGHLVDGNIIYTTCELVLVEIDSAVFLRELDSQTGFQEIKFKQKF